MYKTKNIEIKAKSLGNQFGFFCWKIANQLKKMMTRGSVEKCIKRMELKFSMNCAYMVQNTVQLTYLRVSLSVCLFPLVLVYFPLFCGSKTSNHNLC